MIDKGGNLVSTITDSTIQGPWDSALFDEGSTAKLFVANALSGAVVRYDLVVNNAGVTVIKATQIASGYLHNCDLVTFVDAPTGLDLSGPGRQGVIYLAGARRRGTVEHADVAQGVSVVRFTPRRPPLAEYLLRANRLILINPRRERAKVSLLRRARKKSLTLFLRDRDLPSWSGTQECFSWLCPNGLRDTRASTARSKSFRE